MKTAIFLIPLLCIFLLIYIFFRRAIISSTISKIKYIEMVAEAQEPIPIDTTSWYYKHLKRKGISTKTELEKIWKKELGSSDTFNTYLKVFNYFILAGTIIVFIFAVFFNFSSRKYIYKCSYFCW